MLKAAIQTLMRCWRESALPSAFAVCAIASISVSAFLSSCAPLRPQVAPTPSVSIDQVRQHLQARAFDYASLKSLTKVVVDYYENGKHRSQSFDGALLHRKSGESRLQGFGFMGKKVFDLVYREDRLEIYVPGSKTAYEGFLPPPGGSDELDVFIMLRKALVDTAERYDDGRLQWAAHDPLHPWIDEGHGCLVQLEIDPASLRVIGKTIFQNGAVRATIVYKNYQEVAGREFPLQIALFFPENSLSIAVTFETIAFDEAIPDSRFVLLLPSHTARLPLSKLNIGFLTKDPDM